ncbi:uncharacterized protein J8A68_006103 [[Candida] subhashii]|uniref:Alpha-1,2-mannosyltransferase n=1 Tax=[Candida] subhashii TaxID=561895 RepID=A0A8J5QKX1_9ASCO|nr:uncharacterized protein J8A68_006103 [[Candida] subhashii]KAG7660385.1 hypothetical protein J8A68_006103 [[Candida] subhashii]
MIPSYKQETTIAVPTKTPGTDFWTKVFELYGENRIQMQQNEPSWIEMKPALNENFGRSYNELSQRCRISRGHLEEMKQKHQNVLNNLPKRLPKHTYNPNSKGIVMVGGGPLFNWLAMLSIIQLRDLGSTLPIELILSQKADYSHYYCEKVKKYNAKCVVLSQVLGLPNESQWKFDIHQNRAIGLLVNSFEHVFLLDADNFPVTNIDKYFDSQVYEDHNMVMWPNYQTRSISPLYYDIAGVQLNATKQVRSWSFPLLDPINLSPKQAQNVAVFHDLEGTVPAKSTNSAHLLINKKTHFKALMMSLYYNLLGKDFYYDLFSLGAKGELDKDTLAAAATVTNSSYYQVKSNMKPFVVQLDNGNTGYCATGQHDPQIDYALYSTEYEKLKSNPSNRHQDFKEQSKILDHFYRTFFEKPDKVPLFSVHCNIWKFDPGKLLSNPHIYDPTFNCLKRRMYNRYFYTIGTKSVDFELHRWKSAFKLVCEDKVWFALFENRDFNKLCYFMRNSIQWLTYS